MTNFKGKNKISYTNLGSPAPIIPENKENELTTDYKIEVENCIRISALSQKPSIVSAYSNFFNLDKINFFLNLPSKDVCKDEKTAIKIFNEYLEKKYISIIQKKNNEIILRNVQHLNAPNEINDGETRLDFSLSLFPTYDNDSRMNISKDYYYENIKINRNKNKRYIFAFNKDNSLNIEAIIGSQKSKNSNSSDSSYFYENTPSNQNPFIPYNQIQSNLDQYNQDFSNYLDQEGNTHQDEIAKKINEQITKFTNIIKNMKEEKNKLEIENKKMKDDLYEMKELLEEEKWGKVKPETINFKKFVTINTGDFGKNDIFEVYTSIQDKIPYLVATFANDFVLRIYKLDGPEKFERIKKLEGHKSKISMVRYFCNEKNKEYLISADELKIIYVWDLTNNYDRQEISNTRYRDQIYSCLIVFNIGPENKDFIITSTISVCEPSSKSHYEENSTKKYNLGDKSYEGILIDTFCNKTFYLIHWKNDTNYIIELCKGKVCITNIDDNSKYAELKTDKDANEEFYSGFTYYKNSEHFLVHSANSGFVRIWNLNSKLLVKDIVMKGTKLYQIIKYSRNYFIVADSEGTNQYACKIIDEVNGVFRTEKKGKDQSGAICVKKFVHPIYGKCLLYNRFSTKDIILYTVGQ